MDTVNNVNNVEDDITTMEEKMMKWYKILRQIHRKKMNTNSHEHIEDHAMVDNQTDSVVQQSKDSDNN